MSAAGILTRGSVIGTINDVEIIGSAATQDLQVVSISQEWVNSFIMNITTGNTFALKFTGNSILVTLTAALSLSTETPNSASLTITRIV